MPVPTSKEELISEVTSKYKKLRGDLQCIPEELTKLQDLEGHAKRTTMSVCNLVSYLIGWGELVLKWNKIKDDGKEPDFPETGYKWNELGKLAQKFYADFDGYDYRTLLTKLDTTVKSLLSLIESKTDRQLYGVSWYTKWTLGRMIQFNTSSPYKNARGRISKWKKQHKGKIESETQEEAVEPPKKTKKR